MPKGGKRSDTGSIGPNNVGWQLWNMSKRISSAKWAAHRARQVLDDPEMGRTFSTPGLARLVELVGELEHRAVEADRLWQRLQAVANESDPDLTEPVDGIAVVHNHGDDPVTMGRVRKVWGEGWPRIQDSYELGQELDRLIATERGGGETDGHS